jgi:hypothetical protein
LAFAGRPLRTPRCLRSRRAAALPRRLERLRLRRAGRHRQRTGAGHDPAPPRRGPAARPTGRRARRARRLKGTAAVAALWAGLGLP